MNENIKYRGIFCPNCYADFKVKEKDNAGRYYRYTQIKCNCGCFFEVELFKMKDNVHILNYKGKARLDFSQLITKAKENK